MVPEFKTEQKIRISQESLEISDMLDDYATTKPTLDKKQRYVNQRLNKSNRIGSGLSN